MSEIATDLSRLQGVAPGGRSWLTLHIYVNKINSTRSNSDKIERYAMDRASANASLYTAYIDGKSRTSKQPPLPFKLDHPALKPTLRNARPPMGEPPPRARSCTHQNPLRRLAPHLQCHDYGTRWIPSRPVLGWSDADRSYRLFPPDSQY